MPKKRVLSKSRNRTSGLKRSVKKHFIRGLIKRGEAVRAPGAELPPGVTHELVEADNGNLVANRRRFSFV